MKQYQRHTLALLSCIILSAAPVFAQGEPDYTAEQPGGPGRGDFWVCPGAEAALFSLNGIAFGGSFSLGYGDRVALGLKAAWFGETNDTIVSLEINFLLRWYMLKRAPVSGPFLQAAAGPVLFTQSGIFPAPAEAGRVSASLYFGWRFLLGKHWFIEPGIRAGYPFLAGGGVSGGFRL